MLLGVIFYRPIFGMLLKEADANEWVAKKEKLTELPVKNSVVKTDTLIEKNATSIVTHLKNFFYL